MNKVMKVKKKLYSLAIALGAVSLVGCTNFDDKSHKVEEVYGYNSVEEDLLDYVAISKELESIKFESFGEIPYELDAILADPSTIVSSLQVYYEYVNKFRSGGLDYHEASEFLKSVRFLNTQKRLVNYYLATKGLKETDEIMLNALKSYYREFYGFDNTSEFQLYVSEYSGDPFGLELVSEDYEKIVCPVKRTDTNVLVNNIYNGVSVDESSYGKYNKDVNNFITQSVYTSATLVDTVNKTDVYNKEEVKRLHLNN